MACGADFFKYHAEFGVFVDGVEGFVDGSSVDACDACDADGWDFDFVEVDFVVFGA